MLTNTVSSDRTLTEKEERSHDEWVVRVRSRVRVVESTLSFCVCDDVCCPCSQNGRSFVAFFRLLESKK